MPHSSKITRLIRHMAEDYGVELKIREGSKHYKVYLDDQMISILPNGSGGGGRSMMNTMQHIRKAIEVKLYGREQADTDKARNSR